MNTAILITDILAIIAGASVLAFAARHFWLSRQASQHSQGTIAAAMTPLICSGITFAGLLMILAVLTAIT